MRRPRWTFYFLRGSERALFGGVGGNEHRPRLCLRRGGACGGRRAMLRGRGEVVGYEEGEWRKEGGGALVIGAALL